MPKGDRTGPVGTGPRRGRMAGYCSGFDIPGYANASVTRSTGMGMGRRNRCWGDPILQGRGMRRRHFFSGGPVSTPRTDMGASPARSSQPEERINVLKHQSRTLQAELDAINQRLEAMESPKEEEE